MLSSKFAPSAYEEDAKCAFRQAIADLSRASQLDPSNKEIGRMLIKVPLRVTSARSAAHDCSFTFQLGHLQ
eukprot:2967079-Pleurochrysis_carterae.AAC.1